MVSQILLLNTCEVWQWYIMVIIVTKWNKYISLMEYWSSFGFFFFSLQLLAWTARTHRHWYSKYFTYSKDFRKMWKIISSLDHSVFPWQSVYTKFKSVFWLCIKEILLLNTLFHRDFIRAAAELFIILIRINTFILFMNICKISFEIFNIWEYRQAVTAKLRHFTYITLLYNN